MRREVWTPRCRLHVRESWRGRDRASGAQKLQGVKWRRVEGASFPEVSSYRIRLEEVLAELELPQARSDLASAGRIDEGSCISYIVSYSEYHEYRGPD